MPDSRIVGSRDAKRFLPAPALLHGGSDMKSRIGRDACSQTKHRLIGKEPELLRLQPVAVQFHGADSVFPIRQASHKAAPIARIIAVLEQRHRTDIIVTGHTWQFTPVP